MDQRRSFSDASVEIKRESIPDYFVDHAATRMFDVVAFQRLPCSYQFVPVGVMTALVVFETRALFDLDSREYCLSRNRLQRKRKRQHAACCSASFSSIDLTPSYCLPLGSSSLNSARKSSGTP